MSDICKHCKKPIVRCETLPVTLAARRRGATFMRARERMRASLVRTVLTRSPVGRN